MRMRWGWFWFDEQDELRSSRRPCCVSTGKNPLKKYPRPYAARVLLCDRAAAVSLVFALCRHNIKICQRQEGMKAGGAAIPGRRLWRRGRSRSRRTNEKQRSARHLQPWPNTARAWVERPNKKAKEKPRFASSWKQRAKQATGRKARKRKANEKQDHKGKKPIKATKKKRAYL